MTLLRICFRFKRRRRRTIKSCAALAFITLTLGGNLAPAREPGADTAGVANIDEAVRVVRGFNFQALRLAIADLQETFGAKYPQGAAYLEQLRALEGAVRALPDDARANDAAQADRLRLATDLKRLQRDALLANPLLDFEQLLLIKRAGTNLGLPRNDACYSSVPRTGYDNEITILSPVRPGGKLTTFFRPDGGRHVADLDLHFGADKILFTMPGTNRWQVFEIHSDGGGLRQLTSSPHDDVDSFDACYLPNGKIIFCSTANCQSVPCYNGTRRLGSLYLMDADGRNVRQLTFDQDDDSYPTVANNGRLMFTRWEYAGTPHFFTRLMFQMNPDGTGQEELYGSNSYWPNAVYQARPIPGHATKFIGIVSGHHGDRRMGELVLFDPAKGRQEISGVVQRIPGYGKTIVPVIKDTLVNASWPKFMTPHPLSEKYFLVSCKLTPKSNWGIYLADVFDNLLLIRQVEGYALLEPTPFVKRARPPIIPDRVEPSRKDGLVYLVDVYEGPGLKGVPRGTIKRLRVTSPHFGYFGNAGWLNIAIDGTWDVQRILGTVPVQDDGSAYFRVPANTPISLQPLDAEGRAVQLMRSWFTAMPGEMKSCVGCHEGRNTVTPNVRTKALATGPVEINPWLGPARGFSFERDVQPVLDAHCVSCHDGSPRDDGKKLPDLRARSFFPDYEGVIAPIPMVVTNGHVPPEITVDDVGMETCALSERRQERIKFTPAYEVLHRYVRRGSSESDAYVLAPGEFHADTSEMVQMLKKGHHGVRLDAESWERLYTWIDLNVPCHGTWHEVYEIPFNGHERRREYLKLYGNVDEDYEAIPELPKPDLKPSKPSETKSPTQKIKCAGFPFDQQEAKERQAAAATLGGFPVERKIEIGPGVSLELVLIPAGEFIMGDTQGSEDERPLTPVKISRLFWLGKFEVRNREYALFDPEHDSGYISQLSTAVESRGYAVNEPDQPVVRASWRDAMAFCDWLSHKIGRKFTLPTEAQWEYACRAGTSTALWYGNENTVFNQLGNMADRKLEEMARRVPGKMLYSDHPDWVLRDDRSSDGALVTAKVGSYLPNPWGLYDLHGNAAEWTRTGYRPYPYDPNDGRDEAIDAGRKVVRGGSWYDRPKRCSSASRWSYPAWQGIYNVGFRVACEVETAPVNVSAK